MSDKWRVHIIKGDCEPWLFLDGWENDIKETLEFDQKEEALRQYASLIHHYHQNYENVRSNELALFSFWNEGEKEYCEACDDDLQVFHGVLFAKNDAVYDLEEDEEGLKFLRSGT
ncbi:DUF1033 family protein [Metabacillus iocasae]|uniref:DUF1033 family protein n=1 Tax=Priestia iocasae TaxID=2291674 RepID=A0ABS2QVX2_9BACI|nr:DUF1033 family protein [Metabacillus iocasae]MBM7703630.1 hypothetical protein [Metabacillus iocasae]